MMELFSYVLLYVYFVLKHIYQAKYHWICFYYPVAYITQATSNFLSSRNSQKEDTRGMLQLQHVLPR